MQRRSALLGLCTLAAAPWPAAAQSWPARPLRLVIPFPAGGATDIVGRLLGQKLGAALGQQVGFLQAILQLNICYTLTSIHSDRNSIA